MCNQRGGGEGTIEHGASWICNPKYVQGCQVLGYIRKKESCKAQKNTTEWERCGTYSEVSKVHNSPGSSSIASQNGKNEEPGDEDDKDVRDPYPGILEPRRVLVHVRRLYNLLYIYSSDATLARVLPRLARFLPSCCSLLSSDASPFCAFLFIVLLLLHFFFFFPKP